MPSILGGSEALCPLLEQTLQNNEALRHEELWPGHLQECLLAPAGTSRRCDDNTQKSPRQQQAPRSHRRVLLTLAPPQEFRISAQCYI